MKRLRVIVQTDRQRYSREDWIRIGASLHNDGDTTVYIDRRLFWTGLGGGLALEIMDEHGKHLPARFLSDAIMPPPNPGDSSLLIRLDQEFFYGTSVTLKVKGFFPEPGRYSIRVTYQARLPKELVSPQLRDLPVLWDDTPPMPSEPVWIEVAN